MTGPGPKLAVDNTSDPKAPDPPNGNGGKLRSDFHHLELGMERLRADVISQVSEGKVDNAVLRSDIANLGKSVAESKYMIAFYILISIGVFASLIGTILTYLGVVDLTGATSNLPLPGTPPLRPAG